jgi:hypothetical protein
MYTKLKKAFMSFFKFIIWVGVAAAVQAAINYQWEDILPEWAIYPIAAGLKSFATYWATQKPEGN